MTMDYRLSGGAMPTEYDPILNWNGSDGGLPMKSAPAIASGVSPWLSAGAAGLGVVGSGLQAYLTYQQTEEAKKARKQAQENFERQQKFTERQYEEAAPMRATDLAGSNYSVAEKAQTWRERLESLTRGR